jgi:hypothetical protein
MRTQVILIRTGNSQAKCDHATKFTRIGCTGAVVPGLPAMGSLGRWLDHRDPVHLKLPHWRPDAKSGGNRMIALEDADDYKRQAPSL